MCTVEGPKKEKRKKRNAVTYYLNGFMSFLYSTLNFVTLFKLK